MLYLGRWTACEDLISFSRYLGHYMDLRLLHSCSVGTKDAGGAGTMRRVWSGGREGEGLCLCFGALCWEPCSFPEGLFKCALFLAKRMSCSEPAFPEKVEDKCFSR